MNWDNAYVIYDGDFGKLQRGDVTLDGQISSGNGVGFLSSGASGGGSTFPSEIQHNFRMA